MRMMPALLPFALIGCAGSAPDPGPLVPITYSASGCEGICPVFTVTVTEQGGLFHGERFTRVTGERRFTFTPDQYRAVARALAPIRPTGERQIVDGSPDCGGAAATDFSSVDVRWGERDRLYYYNGCSGGEAERIERILAQAQDLMGIGAFLGEDGIATP